MLSDLFPNKDEVGKLFSSVESLTAIIDLFIINLINMKIFEKLYK